PWPLPEAFREMSCRATGTSLLVRPGAARGVLLLDESAQRRPISVVEDIEPRAELTLGRRWRRRRRGAGGGQRQRGSAGLADEGHPSPSARSFPVRSVI